MRVEQFEFATDYRGPMARLTWKRHEVHVVSWPTSLFEMLEADVLGPQAKAEAASLQEAMAFVHAACGHWVHRDHQRVCGIHKVSECLACGHRHAGRAGW